MNKQNIPPCLHHLSTLVTKWGIEDDGYRDELVFNSTNSDLTELVNSIGDDEANALNDWFCEQELLKKQPMNISSLVYSLWRSNMQRAFLNQEA
jgi:hypothetical protein